MTIHLVTDRKIDSAILETVLGREIDRDGLQIHFTGTRSGAASKARTILVVRKEPVILVLECDDRTLGEEQQWHEGQLNRGGPRELWRVLLVVPTLDVCFFDHPEFVEGLFEAKLSEVDKMLARFRPREVIEKLFLSKGMPYTPESIANFLGDKDLSLLRESYPFRDIRKAIQEIQATVAQAV